MLQNASSTLIIPVRPISTPKHLEEIGDELNSLGVLDFLMLAGRAEALAMKSGDHLIWEMLFLGM
jgi:hypothetical protein